MYGRTGQVGLGFILQLDSARGKGRKLIGLVAGQSNFEQCEDCRPPRNE